MKEANELHRLTRMRSRIPDPRDRQGKRHSRVDILFVALAARVAGADRADGIEEFGEVHEAWFRELLSLEHGIPSQDTFLRWFAALDPDALRAVFCEWVAGVRSVSVLPVSEELAQWAAPRGESAAAW